MTTRRLQGPRSVASAVAAPVFAFALFASACAGSSDPTSTVSSTAAEPAVAAEPAQDQPEAAQEPAEAPPASEDPQGDTSITAAPDAAENTSDDTVAATPVPPAPTAAPAPAEPEDSTTAGTPTEEAPAATVALPAVEVVDLLSGENADLSSLAKPGVTLVWFWAPH